MSNLKLTIDLIPKGAWGNNLRERLPQKNWDKIRETVYSRARNKCQICGADDDLDAHEEWEFDIESRTQTLKGILALCSACHGVKHMRNSERIGYGGSSKRHFLEVNKCSELAFAKHYTEQQILFDERNEVLRWRMKADLTKFGGKGMIIKERLIPLIDNPYEGIASINLNSSALFDIVSNKDNTNPYILSPKVRSIEVDNYQGELTITADFVNHIDWISNGEVIKTKYNNIGKFITKINVEGLFCKELAFSLSGDGGTLKSQKFALTLEA